MVSTIDYLNLKCRSFITFRAWQRTEQNMYKSYFFIFHWKSQRFLTNKTFPLKWYININIYDSIVISYWIINILLNQIFLIGTISYIVEFRKISRLTCDSNWLLFKQNYHCVHIFLIIALLVIVYRWKR